MIMISSIFFRVSKDIIEQQTLALCGNIPIFGCWDPLRAFKLNQQTVGIWSHQSPLAIQFDRRIQFKIISIKNDGIIQWQSLPGDHNRKYKVSQDVLLQMTWGHSKGKKKPSMSKDCQTKRQRSLSPELQRLLKYKPKKMAQDQKQQKFSPFKDAYNSQSESQDHEQKITKDKSSTDNLTKTQFQYLCFKEPYIQFTSQKNPIETLYFLSIIPPSSNSIHSQILRNVIRFSCKIIWLYGYQQQNSIYDNTSMIEYVCLKINSSSGTIDEHISQFQNRSKIYLDINSICFIVQSELFSVSFKQHHLKVQIDQHCQEFIKLSMKQTKIQPLHEKNQNTINQIQNNNIKKIQKANSKHCYQNLLRLKQLIEIQGILLTPNNYFNIHEFENFRAQSKHRLCVFDLPFLFNQDTINETHLNKLKELRHKDCCVVIWSDKSRQQIQDKFPIFQQLQIIMIAKLGQEVWIEGQWINVSEMLTTNFKKIKKSIFKYSKKYGGTIKQQDFKITYSHNNTNINHFVIQLKSILYDKNVIKLSVSLHQITIELPINHSNALMKVIQLSKIRQGQFDLVSTFAYDSKGHYLFKHIQKIIKNCSSFFTNTLKEFYVSSCYDQLDNICYVDDIQWNEIQL